MILLPSREIVQPCPRCGLPPLDPRDPRRWWRHGACKCCDQEPPLCVDPCGCQGCCYSANSTATGRFEFFESAASAIRINGGNNFPMVRRVDEGCGVFRSETILSHEDGGIIGCDDPDWQPLEDVYVWYNACSQAYLFTTSEDTSTPIASGPGASLTLLRDSPAGETPQQENCCGFEMVYDDCAGSGNYANHKFLISNNPCCFNGSLCVEGVDADCDGTCDEDEV